MINNEFSIGTRGSALEGKTWTFQAAPETVEIHKTLGADIVSLANNHVYDFGEEGFTDTLDYLTAAGIPYVGAGRNLDEARQAQYFIVNGVKVGIVAASRAEKVYFTPVATEDTPGIMGTYESADFLEAIKEADAQCDILIDDTSGITVTGMKGKLRRVKNLGLVVVDYLGLMQSDKRIENRVNEVAEISRNLKIMAKELGVPVICCAQLSRGPESRTDKRPMLSDLRDSGAIEQDADVVIFLYKDDYYKTEKENSDEGCIAEVIVAKNRHGSTDTIKMGWIGRYTKFRTIAQNMEDSN